MSLSIHIVTLFFLLSIHSVFHSRTDRICRWILLFCSFHRPFSKCYSLTNRKVLCVFSLQAASPAVERPAGVDRAQGKHTFSGRSVCLRVVSEWTLVLQPLYVCYVAVGMAFACVSVCLRPCSLMFMCVFVSYFSFIKAVF